VYWYRSLSWWRLAWSAARQKPKPSVLSSAWTTSWPISLPIRYVCSPATLCLPVGSVPLRPVYTWCFYPVSLVAVAAGLVVAAAVVHWAVRAGVTQRKAILQLCCCAFGTVRAWYIVCVYDALHFTKFLSNGSLL